MPVKGGITHRTLPYLCDISCCCHCVRICTPPCFQRRTATAEPVVQRWEPTPHFMCGLTWNGANSAHFFTLDLPSPVHHRTACMFPWQPRSTLKGDTGPFRLDDFQVLSAPSEWRGPALFIGPWRGAVPEPAFHLTGSLAPRAASGRWVSFPVISLAQPPASCLLHCSRKGGGLIYHPPK